VPHIAYTDEELGLARDWDLDPDTRQPLSPGVRDELRRARVTQHEVTELRAKVAESERREAFRAAGIPADAKGDLFSKTYEGPDDPATVKAQYEAIFGPPADPANGQTGATTPDPSDAAARRVADAGAAGAGQGGAPGDIDFAEGMRQAHEKGGNAGLKAFIAEHGKFSSPQEIDGRRVYGIKLPDID
jgi:hypothetical protein